MSLTNQPTILEAPAVDRLGLLQTVQTLFFQIASIKTLQTILDVTVLSLAFITAYLLRFDFELKSQNLREAFIQMAVVVPFELALLYFYGVHKFIWRYTSLREGRRIFLSLSIAVIPMLLLRFGLPETYRLGMIPLSIIIFNFCLATTGLIAVRVLRREIHESKHRTRTGAKTEKKAVLLIGAGRAGVMTLAEIKSRGDIDLDVRGFIDDDKVKKGALINGVKVLGSTELLPHLVRDLKIDHVIISLAQASRDDFKRILDICTNIPIKVRTIPGLFELLQDKVTVSRIRDIEIEDLLGRSPIQLDEGSIKSFLNGKTVMVTGAGGSIGSELVRQLAHCRPDKLILVERSEFALFQIEREIKENFPNIDFVPVIGDICESGRMTKVFERHGPQVIFHAAAHKHVPMMELNASEALKNNVLGTNIIGQLAGKYHAEAFVLISTDKAVNPTSIMGGSKRVAELVIQDLNNHFETRFVAVRFGNVIGSNGSVIPTFREQIRKGGPITVTHPEMQRFFMTIPEATQLVLQAGALGKGGEIFILDMGKPIRILDLARETIRLSGLKPDIDIQIAFTGVRPGEKLFEELETDKEQLSKTVHPKIFLGNIAPYPTAKIYEMLDEIRDLCVSEDNQEIRRFLNISLPEANLDSGSEDLAIVLEITGKDAPLSLGNRRLMAASAK